MADTVHWNLKRWLRESRAYPAALAKWPAFNRQQKADRIAIANATGAQWRATDTTGGTDAV